LAAGVASVAAATHTGTIVLRDGTRYQSVEFQVQHDMRVVQFRYEGRNHVIGFNDIRKVLSRANEDITAQTLKPPDPERPIPRSREAPGLFEDPTEAPGLFKDPRAKSTWTWRIHVFGDYSLPAGSYYSGVGGSIGGGVHLCLPANSRIGLMLAVHRAGFSSRNHHSRIRGTKGSAIGVQAGLETFWSWDAYHGMQGLSFAYAGVGLVTHEVRKDVIAGDFGSLPYIVGLSDSQKTFAGCLGFGAIFPLGEYIYLHAGTHWEIMKLDAYPQVYAPTGEGGLVFLGALQLGLAAMY
jgi:hypothetical protein